MRTRATMQAVAALLGCLMLATQGGAQTRSFVPGDTYVECISYRQLGDGDDFPGMWEYVYDVVGSTDGSGLNHAWTRNVSLSGFDGTQIANQYLSDWGYTGVTQRWDDHTTEGYSPWGGYQLRNEYPSYWDEVSPSLSEWVLPLAEDANAAWGMINQWHSGDEYTQGLSFWSHPGVADADGLSWTHDSSYTNYYGLDGLLLTFRVVHPEGPGVIEWGTYYNDTLGTPMDVVGTTVGPVPEPATMGLLVLGALALLRKRR